MFAETLFFRTIIEGFRVIKGHLLPVFKICPPLLKFFLQCMHTGKAYVPFFGQAKGVAEVTV